MVILVSILFHYFYRIMVRCQCYKHDGRKCSRNASTKVGDNPLFCWQHQKCQTVAKQIPKSILLKIAKIPILPKATTEAIPLKVTKKPISQLINHDQFVKIYPEKKIIGEGTYGEVYSSGQFIVKKSSDELNSFEAF